MNARTAPRLLAVTFVLALLLGEGSAMALIASPDSVRAPGLTPRVPAYPTSLTIAAKPSKSIVKGKSATFSGKLSSPEPWCAIPQTVRLFRNTKAVQTKTTSATGSYAFKVKVKKTYTWTARFAGATTGVHPNVINCLGAQSAGITLKVKKPH